MQYDLLSVSAEVNPTKRLIDKDFRAYRLTGAKAMPIIASLGDFVRPSLMVPLIAKRLACVGVLLAFVNIT